MRKYIPAHVRRLTSLGHTLGEVNELRRALEPHKITVGYNTSLRVWILGRVGRLPGGPDFICLKLGTEAFTELLAGQLAGTEPAGIVGCFDAQEKGCVSHD